MINQYRILPVLLDDGTPAWTIVRDFTWIYGSASKIMATNTDRSILERAIAHLEQPPVVTGSTTAGATASK